MSQMLPNNSCVCSSVVPCFDAQNLSHCDLTASVQKNGTRSHLLAASIADSLEVLNKISILLDMAWGHVATVCASCHRAHPPLLTAASTVDAMSNRLLRQPVGNQDAHVATFAIKSTTAAPNGKPSCPLRTSAVCIALDHAPPTHTGKFACADSYAAITCP